MLLSATSLSDDHRDDTLKRLRNPLIQLIMETSEQSSNTEDTDLLPNFPQGEND